MPGKYQRRNSLFAIDISLTYKANILIVYSID